MIHAVIHTTGGDHNTFRKIPELVRLEFRYPFADRSTASED